MKPKHLIEFNHVCNKLSANYIFLHFLNKIKGVYKNRINKYSNEGRNIKNFHLKAEKRKGAC